MKILIVDDERNIRESIQRLFELEGIASSTATDGNDAVKRLAEEAFDAVVLDLKMPGMDGQALLEWIRAEGLRTPVIMISALGDINDAVKALKSGANDYLIKPFDPTELILKVKRVVESRKRGDLIEAGSRTADENARLLGEGATTRALRLLIDKVAAGDVTVLITGESGTGKEVVAREIHARGANAAEPFVAVNIGAIPDTLVESELFGHEKGAFTGADSRKTGLFELAERGTLFLDEIAEMPLPLQVKLLRVLQERKIRRLGGTRDIPVAARILSATNKDIESLVQSGAFREDLYYRLNVVRIAVPPLRDRKEDIPLLCGHFLGKLKKRTGRALKSLSPDAMDALLDYSFPGNIRELENILERAVITSEDDVIMAADLSLGMLKKTAADATRTTPPAAASPTASAAAPDPGPAAAPGSAPAPTRGPAPATARANDLGPAGSMLPQGPAAPVPAGPASSTAGSLKLMKELEREALVAALKKWDGNRTRAAAELGISRRTILNKIKQYGL